MPISSQHTPPTLQVVDTLEKAAHACALLKKQHLLSFDIEGKKLGRYGEVSIIQIATPQRKVYLFDVLALGQSLFDAKLLLPILSDPNILKLCYDCRCDSEALYHLYRIQMFGLYDLQIVYTLLFQSKKDPFLKGLHKAMKKIIATCEDINTFETASADLEIKIKTKHEWNPELMMQRPISPDILKYCAIDVVHLFEMYRQWWNFSDSLIVWFTYQRMMRFLYRTPLETEHMIMSKIDFVNYYENGSTWFVNSRESWKKKRTLYPVKMGLLQEDLGTGFNKKMKVEEVVVNK